MNFEMSFFENEFYTLVADYIEEKQIGSKYDIRHRPNINEFSININDSYTAPDFIILKGSHPFIIVSVIETNIIKIGSLSNRMAEELEITGADYHVITNLEQIVILNKENRTAKSEYFENIYALLEELNIDETNTLKIAISKQIKEIARDFANKKTESQYSLNKSLELLQTDNLIDQISYNSDGRFFHFKTNPETMLTDFENIFFQSLLEPVEDDSICRYTSLDSLYQTVNGKSYRMSSHIGMNDRSEIDYVDKYIDTDYKPLQGFSLDEMKKINKSYISSCTTINKEDNLTMYRLYAEDSKGVCLRYNLVKNLLSNNLIVRKISYALGPNNHPQLELIKEIISKLKDLLRIKFRLLYVDLWKHFFKTHDYTIEEEIRLLYIEKNHPSDKKGWILTHTDRILSKYVLFDLNGIDFPLKLSKVILGPNFPERQLNRRQFEVLLSEKQLDTVTVEISKIESYRRY